jgi:hypothetical protein
MVVQAIVTRATVNVAQRVVVQQQRRFAGGHAKAKVEWTGIDKVVRGYFPEDYQCTSSELPLACLFLNEIRPTRFCCTFTDHFLKSEKK